jgi:hypothetical protein
MWLAAGPAFDFKTSMSWQTKAAVCSLPYRPVAAEPIQIHTVIHPKTRPNMNCTDASDDKEPLVSPQTLHREAMEQLQKALEHHQQAALFHESGDAQQAATHGTMAFDRAAHAVEISGRAMFVQPAARRPRQRPKTLSWDGLVVAFSQWRRNTRST